MSTPKRCIAPTIYVYDGAEGYRFYGLNYDRGYGQSDNKKIIVQREFKNAETNQLGIALPAGKLRFYRRDDDGQLQFVGENTIDHTPRNETVRVTTGNAFDLVGERKQTDFHVDTADKWMDETFEIKLRNRKKDRRRGNPRGRAPLPLEQLERHGQVRRVHEERLADHRVPHPRQARRGKDRDLHGALFVVTAVRLGASFRSRRLFDKISPGGQGIARRGLETFPNRETSHEWLGYFQRGKPARICKGRYVFSKKR